MSNEQHAPAFPARIRDDDGVVWPAFGLTKLEYAVIKIAAGIWANPAIVDTGSMQAADYINDRATHAVRALFAELEKSE